MFWVDLKTLLSFVLPNQYCHVIMRKNRGRVLGYIISWIAPTPSMSLIYSTIVLYDNSKRLQVANTNKDTLIVQSPYWNSHLHCKECFSYLIYRVQLCY